MRSEHFDFGEQRKRTLVTSDTLFTRAPISLRGFGEAWRESRFGHTCAEYTFSGNEETRKRYLEILFSMSTIAGILPQVVKSLLKLSTPRAI